MIERLARNPAILAIAFLLSAFLGAAFFALIQSATADAPAARDRAAMETVVRDYVLDNPEILPEAMARLENRRQATSVSEHREALTDPFAGAWTGARDGDVDVVVFMDYACGYCRASLPAIEQLVESDPGVRIVYRELPILSSASREAARWALAAAEQDRFMAFHEALYADGQLSMQSIERAIAAAGLDRDRAARAMASQAIDSELGGNLDLANALGIGGTPAWVIGDRVLAGAQDRVSLAQAVAAAREG